MVHSPPSVIATHRSRKKKLAEYAQWFLLNLLEKPNLKEFLNFNNQFFVELGEFLNIEKKQKQLLELQQKMRNAGRITG